MPSGIITYEGTNDLRTPGFRKIFFDHYRKLTSIISLLFDEQKADRSFMKDSGVTGISNPSELNGNVAYNDIKQAYDITVNFPEIAGGYAVQRKISDDDEYNVINRLPGELGISFARKRDQDAEDTFAEAFTYQPTDGDGVELCGSDHPSPLDSSYSESNEGTSSLSPASVTATRITMRKTKDMAGYRAGIMPDELIVPVDLQYTAEEIVKSTKKAHEMSNTYNVNNGWKIVVLNYVTNANNWFMADSEMLKKHLVWVDRILAEFNQDLLSDSFNSKFYGYARWNKYWNNWRSIFGHLIG